MQIIDTHQHLWDLTQFTYSWTANHPPLNRSFVMDDYLRATQSIDLLKSVHVEADVDEPFMLGETRHILALAADPDNPLSGVVAAGRPERADFAEYLEQIAGHPALKGVRRLLQSEPDELSTSELFVENVRRLERYGLSFDICVRARQLPLAVGLVNKCPGVQFILDHCGNPLINKGNLKQWRADIAELAKRPNVVGKISGLVMHVEEEWTADDLRPAVEQMIECFGWERVMFGSDWPVCTTMASLKQWAEALIWLTRDAGEANQRKLFQENAERIYRL